MCFSESASVAGGLAVGGLGIATLPLVRERKQMMFAALPLVFGVHQLLEGAVWDQLDASGQAAIRTPAVEAWLLIAWLVLPVWVPIAVLLCEPDEGRRRWLLVLVVVGSGIGAYLAFESVAAQTTVSAADNHLHYALPMQHGWVLGLPYVAATCGALLLSSHRFVVTFGGALFVTMGAAAVLYASGFSSVWCFFAALLSGMVFVHYAGARARERVVDTHGSRVSQA
jgi:Family of unknown function (DUF6629)